MMTGKELEKIAEKYKKMGRGFWGDVPTILENYNWDAIAAEIAPKPLTMEELVEYFNEAVRNGKVYFEDVSTFLWVGSGASIDLSVLLDLINNKQKEGIR